MHFYRRVKDRKQAQREKETWLLVVSPSLKAYTATHFANYYRALMQIDEGFRDTKSTHYGLDLAREGRIQAGAGRTFCSSPPWLSLLCG